MTPTHQHPAPRAPLRLLFLCARNQWRSPTAEAVYQNDPRVEVASAGVSAATRRRVTEKLLLWADVILVMEHAHKRRLHDNFPAIAPGLKIGVLDIPDDYAAGDAELISLIRERVEPWITQWESTAAPSDLPMGIDGDKWGIQSPSTND